MSFSFTSPPAPGGVTMPFSSASAGASTRLGAGGVCARAGESAATTDRVAGAGATGIGPPFCRLSIRSVSGTSFRR